MRKRTRLLLFCVYTCLPCSFWLLLLFLFSCEVEIATCPLLLSPRSALPCVPQSCVLDRFRATLARAMLFRVLEKGGLHGAANALKSLPHTQSLEDIEAMLVKAERSMNQLKCKVSAEAHFIRYVSARACCIFSRCKLPTHPILTTSRFSSLETTHTCVRVLPFSPSSFLTHADKQKKTLPSPDSKQRKQKFYPTHSRPASL